MKHQSFEFTCIHSRQVGRGYYQYTVGIPTVVYLNKKKFFFGSPGIEPGTFAVGLRCKKLPK